MTDGIDLGKQVGPLPLGVWIGVGAIGLTIGYFINKRMAQNANAAQQDPIMPDSDVGTGGRQLIYDPPTNATPETAPETNQSWGIKVTNWLVGKGMNAVAADQAVRKYLSANALTPQEKSMINLAILQFGVPPEPLPPMEEDDTGGGTNIPPIIITPKPTPKPVPPGSAVVALHVNRATGRNEVVWNDDHNPDTAVDYYVVSAMNIQNSKSVVATVLEVPGIQTYSWTHVASPTQGTQQLTYRYTVTPYKAVAGDDLAGPASTVQAIMST